MNRISKTGIPVFGYSGVPVFRRSGSRFTPDTRHPDNKILSILAFILCILSNFSSPLSAQGEAGAVTALAFSPDGKRLAVGAYGQVVLYDTATWQPASAFTQVEDTVRALAFHPDGKTLVVGSGLPGRTGTIVFWDTSGAKKPGLLPPQKDTIEALAFRKDGKALLVAGNDGKAHYYPNLPYGAGPTLDEHNGRVQAVAFSPNEGFIFVTGAMDKVVKVWDAKATTTHTVVNFDQSQGGITGLAFLPSGTQFVGSSLDGNLYWWSVAYDEKRRVFSGSHDRTIQAHENGVYALGASADGQRLITGGADKVVSVWKADDGAKIADFKEATQPLYAVALSPDGKLAAAGGREGVARVYEVEGNKLLATLILPPLPAPAKPATTKPAAPAKSPQKPPRPGRKP